MQAESCRLEAMKQDELELEARNSGCLGGTLGSGVIIQGRGWYAMQCHAMQCNAMPCHGTYGMYVCMHACMYVRTYVCMYVGVCMCVYVYMCIRVYVYMCICAYVHMCICVYVYNACICV